MLVFLFIVLQLLPFLVHVINLILSHCLLLFIIIFLAFCFRLPMFWLYNLFNSNGDAYATFYVCILFCKVDLILLFSFVYSSKLNLFCYFLFFIFLEVFFLNCVAGYVFFQFYTFGGFNACTTKGLHFPLVHLYARFSICCFATPAILSACYISHFESLLLLFIIVLLAFCFMLPKFQLFFYPNHVFPINLALTVVH